MTLKEIAARLERIEEDVQDRIPTRDGARIIFNIYCLRVDIERALLQEGTL